MSRRGGKLPHVLVVGGGFAGVCAAETLVRSSVRMNVTLVASQDYFEFLPSSLRCMVHPKHIDGITCDLRQRRFDFIHGTVLSLSRRNASVEEHAGDMKFVKSASNAHRLLAITFSYCIWAAGVSYPAPIKTFGTLYNLPQRRAELAACRSGLLDARRYVSTHTLPSLPYCINLVLTSSVSRSRILVIGGGLAGVELAAELVAGLPNPRSRSIILATSSRGLLPRLPPRAGAYALAWFKSRGVQIVLSRVMHDPHDATDSSSSMHCFKREDGLSPIFANLAFECTGGWSGSGCSALVEGGVAREGDINLYGKISVRETLQFLGAANIFAAGDCALVPGELVRSGAFAEKTAYAAMEAGRLAARNVGAMLIAKGRASYARLESFPRDAFPLGKFPRLFAISLYKFDGLLCIGPLVVTGRPAALAKLLTEVLGCAAMSGNRVCESLFSCVERTFFVISVVVQFLFRS